MGLGDPSLQHTSHLPSAVNGREMCGTSTVTQKRSRTGCGGPIYVFAKVQCECGKDGEQVPAMSSSALPAVSCGSHFRGTLLGDTGPPLPSRCSTERRSRPCLPSQPGRGGSPRSARHAGLGTLTPSQLGFRLVGLGGRKQLLRKHLRKFGRAEAGREWVGAGQRGCAGLLPSPHGGRSEGAPYSCHRLFSPGREKLSAFCSVQIPLFSHRFLITFFEFEWIFFGRYDRV